MVPDRLMAVLKTLTPPTACLSSQGHVSMAAMTAGPIGDVARACVMSRSPAAGVAEVLDELWRLGM